MDVRMELSAEVSRILQSPYVPCLKKLHDLLQTADFRTVQNWADGNVCQIEGLANAVLDGLQSWPFVLHTLRVLSGILSFRDAILRQNPILLDTLLTEATMSEQGFQKYSTACTSLLSAPLLQVPIPAAITSFLQKLMERGVQAPSAENIRPLYSILSGIGFNFLDILPLEIVNRFQSQLIKILKSLEVEDHSANLICLAILANVASQAVMNSTASDGSCMPNATSSRIQDEPPSSDRYQSSRQFFTAKRASKTLDLVVLKVILSCSRSCSLRLDEVMESLSLSQEIIDAVPCSERSSWMERNSGKVKKLSEKILRHDIDRELECAALGFIASLSEEQVFPEALAVAAENLLCNSNPYVLSPKAFQRFMIRLNGRSVSAKLLALVQAASVENLPTRASLTSTQDAEHWVLNIDAAVQTSSILRQKVLLSLSSKEVDESLRRFAKYRLSVPNTDVRHERLEVCPQLHADARQRLHKRLCDFLLKTACHATTDETRLDTSVGLALLEKRHSVSSSILPCEYHSPSLSSFSMASASLFGAGSTPQTLTGSNDWRNRLMKELTRDAKYRYESIVKMVGDICQDLERRCDEAERPFRTEQAKNSDLMIKLEASQAKLVELESKVLERTQLSDCLEIERNYLQEQVQAFEHRAQVLSSRLTELEQESCETKQESNNAVEAARETAKQQELTYLASMTGKDELLEQRGVKLADLEAHANSLQNEVTDLCSQKVHSEEEIRDLEGMVKECNEVIEQLKATIASKDASVDRLVQLEASLTSENQGLMTEAQRTLDERNSKVSKLEAQIHRSRSEVLDLQKEYDMYSSTKADEILRLGGSHKVAVDELNVNLYETTEKAALKLRHSEAQIKDLEKKVNQLCRERVEQAKELTEAQEFKVKLMTVMDTVGQNSAALNQPDSRKPGLIEKDQDVQGTVGPLLWGEPEANPTRSFESSISSISGSTSKRNKTRRSLNPPLPQPTRVARGASRGKSLSNTALKSKKHPLKDLDMNAQNAGYWSPTQSQDQKSQDHFAWIPRPASKENDNDDLAEDLGETSFGSDVFTSTNQYQLIGSENKIPSDIYDETTVDV